MSNDIQSLLERAREAFLRRDYALALSICSLANSKLSECYKATKRDVKFMLKIKLYAALADLADEIEMEAKTLFDYYDFLNTKDEQDAEAMVLAMVSMIDKNISQANDELLDTQGKFIEQNDGILYADFADIVHKRGFHDAFIDVIANSKIIFTDKRDFFIFVKDLLKHGFKDIAVNYFEDFGRSFFYDAAFEKIYKEIKDTL